jgi:hypothetical protein
MYNMDVQHGCIDVLPEYAFVVNTDARVKSADCELWFVLMHCAHCRYGGLLGQRLASFLSTGNITSMSGLDLMQVIILGCTTQVLLRSTSEYTTDVLRVQNCFTAVAPPASHHLWQRAVNDAAV